MFRELRRQVAGVPLAGREEPLTEGGVDADPVPDDPALVTVQSISTRWR